jgi:hypothetical protein
VNLRHRDLACALLLFAPVCQAHTLSVSHLDIDVPADGTVVHLELDLAWGGVGRWSRRVGSLV